MKNKAARKSDRLREDTKGPLQDETNIYVAESSSKSSVASLMSKFSVANLQKQSSSSKQSKPPVPLTKSQTAGGEVFNMAPIAVDACSSQPQTPTNSARSNYDPKWKQTLIGFGLLESDAETYAQIFFDEDVTLSQLNELTDEFLFKIGIAKGGHRLRILSQKKQNSEGASISFEEIIDELSQIRNVCEQFTTRIAQLEARLQVNGGNESNKPKTLDLPTPKPGWVPAGAALQKVNDVETPAPQRAPSPDIKEEKEEKGIRISDLHNPSKERTFIELLLQHHCITLSVMEAASPNEMDSLASSLVNVFETQRVLTHLLLASIDREVKVAPTEKTLFRANTVHSKILSAHAKIVGHIYLRQTLGVYVNLMIAESIPLEVDPTRLKPTESLPENQKNLQEMTKKFVQGLQRSIDLVPFAFRDICHQLKEKVSARFADANALVSVGSFFFLRYACPAVINPTSFGLSSVNPSPICQRGLLLVAKILQNLSNGTKFNEPYMQFMNEYLLTLQPTITHFCEQLASLPSSDSRDNANHVDIPKEQLEQSISTIYRIAHENFDKISTSLIKDNMNNLRDQVAEVM